MGTCGSVTSVGADIWKQWGKEIKLLTALGGPGVYASVTQYEECVKKMVKFWNKNAKKTWARIGPRRLEINKELKGTIVGAFGRVFITPAPLDKEKITVRIKKLDGKAKTSVTVCRIGPGKKCKKIWDFTYASGKDNIGKKFEKTFTGVQDRIISVHLDGKSVTNKFKYSLKAGKATTRKKAVAKKQTKSTSRTGARKSVTRRKTARVRRK